jgi:hypothetical protein
MSDDFFALPSFKAESALQQLQRQLREMRPLAERQGTYELRAKPVVKLALAASGDAIDAQVAKAPAHTPQWERVAIKSSADVRKFVENVKARLSRWTDED